MIYFCQFFQNSTFSMPLYLMMIAWFEMLKRTGKLHTLNVHPHFINNWGGDREKGERKLCFILTSGNAG